MTVAFRADAEPPRSRDEYWRHVVGETITPLEVIAPGGLGSRDRLLVGGAGAVSVAALSVGEPSVAERRPSHIRRSDPDLVKVDVLAGGSGVIEQDGRAAVQRPGDLTFVDLSRPCRWSLGSARVVALRVPRALLPLRREELARLTGVRIPGDRGAGALASSLARELAERLDDCGAAQATRLGTAVLDVLTVALAARLDRRDRVPPDTRRRALLQGALAFIEERLADPALSPARVAGAQFISVRYLHRLFESQEATVAAWIRTRRLERCRADLLDPALRTRPVSAIAARWGMTDAGRFSRAFRAAYGMPPGEYRLLAAGRAGGGR